MQTGRPKKPTELKKLQGTYRKDRDANRPDQKLKNTSLILDAEKVRVPKTITNPFVKKYFINLTNGLLSIGVLSGADLPQIEQMCLILQKMQEVQQQFLDTSVFDDDFDLVEKRYLRLVEKFDFLATKYYVSPVARSRIRLEELNIREKEIDVAEKQTNAVNNLLNMRKVGE